MLVEEETPAPMGTFPPNTQSNPSMFFPLSYLKKKIVPKR
jgi:hypothetical protein